VAGWDDLTFLNKARLLKQGALANTALLLLGRSEATTLLAPAVAKVSWILKDADNRELDYEHLGPPFLLAGARLLQRLRNLTHVPLVLRHRVRGPAVRAELEEEADEGVREAHGGLELGWVASARRSPWTLGPCTESSHPSAPRAREPAQSALF